MKASGEEALLEKAYRLGSECTRNYKGCSQCVVAAVHDTLGIRDDAVFKAAGGHAEKCPDVVGQAARMTVKIILDEKLVS